MVDVYGELLLGSRDLPVRGQQLALGCDRVDVVRQREGDHVGRQSVDHRAGLFAGAAMRLADRQILAGLLLPVLFEGLVVVVVELAGRVVRDVEQGRFGAHRCRCQQCRRGEGRDACEPENSVNLHVSFSERNHRGARWWMTNGYGVSRMMVTKR